MSSAVKTDPSDSTQSIPVALPNIHRQRVWDGVVRGFHWSLVALCITTYLSGETGAEDLHMLRGYLFIPLLRVRLLWGLWV